MRAVDPKLRLSGLPEILPFRRREDFDRWAGALHLLQKYFEHLSAKH
jgi:hypothetical protein